ncbi:hypothetical protein BGX29_009238, partial [Mortierella sp. GBA35]
MPNVVWDVVVGAPTSAPKDPSMPSDAMVDDDLEEVEAHFAMGEKYFKGEAVIKDNSQAMEWYRKAADRGHAGAQYKIGLIHVQLESAPMPCG